MSEPTLTIGYSVLGSRLANLRLPSPQPDVELLVVLQGAPPAELERRADVRYVQLGSSGVAKSRNEVLHRARGQIVLFGDDDVLFDEVEVRRMLNAFVEDRDLALALGCAVDQDGRLRKRYPRRSSRLHRWNSGKAATYEIMLRRSAFAAVGVRFDEEFGAGAHNYLGDEYILIADAIGHGLRCRFFPYVLATHPAVSSGSGFGTSVDTAARAAVFDRVFGRGATLARFAFLLRTPRRFHSAGLAVRFVLGRVPG